MKLKTKKKMRTEKKRSEIIQTEQIINVHGGW